MRKASRLVPAAIFFYDCSRLLFLLTLLYTIQSTGLQMHISNLPLMMYSAPNALFPLMSFFLLIRSDGYGNFIPLYITGKVLALLCMLIWLFFVFQQIIDIRRVMWAIFFCAADLGTIMGMAMQNKKIQSPGGE
jgi:hypothetical protein